MAATRKQRISKLLVRIKDQRKWVERCGGCLSGYIETYGDPGIPPIIDGKPQIISVPQKHVNIFPDKLVPVKGAENLFYAPHIGDGGTAIWEADSAALRVYEDELTMLRGLRK